MPEPQTQRDRHRDQHGLRAHPEQQPPRGHQEEIPRAGGHDRTDQAQTGGPERDAAGAESIHDEAADQDQHDIGQTVDGVQRADLRVAEAEFSLQGLSERTDGVVDVVVTEHQQADENEDPPARGAVIGMRVSDVGHRRML